MPMPMRVGTTAIMPPDTPLLAGMPTRMANSPEPSYMPQVMRIAFTYRARAAGKTLWPESGSRPRLASTAPIWASPWQSTRMEQARK